MSSAVRMAVASEPAREQRFGEAVVARLALFRGVSAPDLAAINRQCALQQARAGEVIARRGYRLPGLFAVASGTVKLSLRGGEHGERVVRLVSAGETFGEATALLGKPSRYEARALADARLVVIPTAAIAALMEHDARFSRGLVMSMAARELELAAELEAATVLGGAERLAAYLKSLCDGGGDASKTVQLPVSKTVVAARLGIKKETLSRLLRQLTTEGLIKVSNREISILDRARLFDMARGEAAK